MELIAHSNLCVALHTKTKKTRTINKVDLCSLGRTLFAVSAHKEFDRKQRRLDELLETSRLEIKIYNLMKVRLE